jgi:hypothetical protein
VATDEESLTLAIVAALRKCPGATARELAGRLRLRYPDANKSRVNGILYRHDDLFSREADGNSWALKPERSVVDDDYETCVSCGVTKGVSAFRTSTFPAHVPGLRSGWSSRY